MAAEAAAAVAAGAAAAAGAGAAAAAAATPGAAAAEVAPAGTLKLAALEDMLCDNLLHWWASCCKYLIFLSI